MPELKNTTAGIFPMGLQFRLLTIFVVMTWIACTTFLLLNTTLAVAILSVVVLTFGFFEAAHSISPRYTVRERIQFAIKAGVTFLVLAAAFAIAAISPYRELAFQPMYNRAERARMTAIAHVLAQDKRFANMHVSLVEFKGFQHVHLEGTVPDAMAMEDLEQLLAKEVGVDRFPWDIEVER